MTTKIDLRKERWEQEMLINPGYRYRKVFIRVAGRTITGLAVLTLAILAYLVIAMGRGRNHEHS